MLKQAAEEGYDQALRKLGNLYRDGKHVKQSLSSAFRYIKRAAELGLGDAQIELGLFIYLFCLVCLFVCLFVCFFVFLFVFFFLIYLFQKKPR
jgi:uncharacterized membrane protein